jgi:hypothetical protein
LVNKEGNTDAKVGEFATLFSSVTEIIFEAIDEMGAQAPAVQTSANVYEMAKKTFNVTSSESGSPSNFWRVRYRLLENNMATYLIGLSKRASVMV